MQIFFSNENNQTTIGVEAVVGSYGLGFGFIFAFLGMVFFVYVCELFPVDVRNAGVGLSYNIGILDFGPKSEDQGDVWHGSLGGG